MKKRTRISIRTRQTVRVAESSLQCPQCGAEVPLGSSETRVELPAAVAAQVQEVLTNAEIGQPNRLDCGHLLPAANYETEV